LSYFKSACLKLYSSEILLIFVCSQHAMKIAYFFLLVAEYFM